MLVVFGLLETRAERSQDPPGRGGCWPANSGPTGLNMFVLGALPISGVVFADWMLAAGVGPFNRIERATPGQGPCPAPNPKEVA